MQSKAFKINDLILIIAIQNIVNKSHSNNAINKQTNKKTTTIISLPYITFPLP